MLISGTQAFYDFLLQETGETAGQINDLQDLWLVGLGYTDGTLDDRIYQYLDSIGLPGGLTDKIARYNDTTQLTEGSVAMMNFRSTSGVPFLYWSGARRSTGEFDTYPTTPTVDAEGILRDDGLLSLTATQAGISSASGTAIVRGVLNATSDGLARLIGFYNSDTSRS